MNQAVNRLLQRIAPLILAVAGVVFLIVGVHSLNQKKTFLPATGVIQSIEVEPATTEDEADSYTVIVEYTIDGTTYYSDLGEIESGYHEGKEISFLYDPDNPENITVTSKTGSYIAMVFGVVCLLGGVFAFVRRIITGR